MLISKLEESILEADVVEVRVELLEEFVLEELLLIEDVFEVALSPLLVVDVLVEDSPNDDGEACEHKVVKGNVEVVVDCLRTPSVPEAVEELGKHEDCVLVEEVEYHVAYADVRPTPVHEDEFPKRLKVYEGVVTRLHSPKAFLTIEANANMCPRDHVDIVCPIANGKRNFVKMFAH